MKPIHRMKPLMTGMIRLSSISKFTSSAKAPAKPPKRESLMRSRPYNPWDLKKNHVIKIQTTNGDAVPRKKLPMKMTISLFKNKKPKNEAKGTPKARYSKEKTAIGFGKTTKAKIVQAK